VTWDDVRELALALPEAEPSTLYRKPAYRIRGKAFAWESPHERGALVLRCDVGERPLIIQSRPEAFFITPHYEPHAMVLVRVDAADREELADRIEESWLLSAPRQLADAYAASRPTG
jgi:hypothetical protein